MRNTSLKNAHEVNLLGNMNYKYIFITKFVKKLRLAASKLTAFHRQYEYYWHRTDLLYEIWGYIGVNGTSIRKVAVGSRTLRMFVI